MLSRLSRRLLPGLHQDITTRIRFPEKRSFLPVAAIALLLFTALCQTLSAQALLGTAQSFAVLGASTVTNTGPSVVTGNLGLSPGTSITGFPPGTVVGTTYIGGVAAPARADALNAYNVLAGTAPTRDLSGTDLGGLTLGPGVYFFSSSAGLTGTLTLDAQNNPNAVFIFRIGSSLVTGSNSSVIMINPAGGALCNVFFQVGSSATLGTGTQFLGTILADASVTVETGAGVEGRVVALTGAVTLDSNIVSVGSCNNGSLQVCKVAGAGVTAGTPFSFSISPVIPPQSTTVTVAAGPAPLGTCSAAIAVPAGSVQIQENLLVPGGYVPTSIFTLPSGALENSTVLTAGTAYVTVTAGATTTVTFVDASPPPPAGFGYLQVCKVAGNGVTQGTDFYFAIPSAIPPIPLPPLPGQLPVPAGAAPGGTCSAPVLVPASTPVSVQEVDLPAGVVPTSIFTFPSGALGSPTDVATGLATVTVADGGTTFVTFVDATPPPPGGGYLQVCKVAGDAGTLGKTFNFTIGGVGIPGIVAGAAPGGTCGPPVPVVSAFPVAVAEVLTGPGGPPGGAVPTSISVLPSGALAASPVPNPNLAAGTATVTVIPGITTIVTFTDAVPTGSLMICKVAQGGVLSGNVTFSVAGTLVMVPAGPAPVGSCSPALVEPAGLVSITETIPSGFLLTSIATLPSGALASPAPNLAAGTATVTVYAGGQTIVTFTDGIPTQEMCYAANLQAGESYINIGNTGYNGDSLTGPGSGAFGNLCVNVYAFDATDEQLISCCSCLVTPNAMVSLGAKADLTSNTDTGVHPLSITVKLLATLAGPGGTGTACNNSAESVTLSTVVPGIVAFGTTLHAAPTAGTYATTGAACIPGSLGAQDVASVAYRCAFIIGNSSNSGICLGCQAGAQ